jgi:hypothetical protein
MVYIDVAEVKKETDKAFLCRVDGLDAWIPKSQIESPDEFGVGDLDREMEVTEWIANEKGLPYQ